MGTGPKHSVASTCAAVGSWSPLSLPFLAGALARAEPADPAAAPHTLWPELRQLRRAPLQQLLPAPCAAPLQLPQLLLMPSLQLHEAFQLLQFLQTGGPGLCGDPREASYRPGAPLFPTSPESSPGWSPRLLGLNRPYPQLL